MLSTFQSHGVVNIRQDLASEQIHYLLLHLQNLPVYTVLSVGQGVMHEIKVCLALQVCCFDTPGVLIDGTGRPGVVDVRGDRSVELSEIDERLSRLQQFMKENLK